MIEVETIKDMARRCNVSLPHGAVRFLSTVSYNHAMFFYLFSNSTMDEGHEIVNIICESRAKADRLKPYKGALIKYFQKEIEITSVCV